MAPSQKCMHWWVCHIRRMLCKKHWPFVNIPLRLFWIALLSFFRISQYCAALIFSPELKIIQNDPLLPQNLDNIIFMPEIEALNIWQIERHVAIHLPQRFSESPRFYWHLLQKQTKHFFFSIFSDFAHLESPYQLRYNTKKLCTNCIIFVFDIFVAIFKVSYISTDFQIELEIWKLILELIMIERERCLLKILT